MNHTTQIADAIVRMATNRGTDKTICPSEVARALFPADWRRYMEETRQVAISLQQAGKVQITQNGEPVDINDIKGPIRIRIVTTS